MTGIQGVAKRGRGGREDEDNTGFAQPENERGWIHRDLEVWESGEGRLDTHRDRKQIAII